MNTTFGKKYYDVLVGEGPGGSNLYTTILSTEQKRKLAMMQSADEVRAELNNIRNCAASDAVYVQEERDIKDYINKRGLFWAHMMWISCCIAGGALFTLDAFKNDHVSLVLCSILLVLGCIGIAFSDFKASKYKKQKDIMRYL